MKPIIIAPTDSTPLVDFGSNGHFLIEGRSRPEDAVKFFRPLIEFIEYSTVSEVNFDINLEYFNTATSKNLLELLKVLDANRNIERVFVNWHFEKGDEDSIEMAEIFEDYLNRIYFRYIDHEQFTSLINNNSYTYFG